ncbi:hypothetical protein FPE01S_02_09210 [Flavihumibacter petaseus NBRC 106054]|uniref:Pectate lyase superfamily protein domain-containing protein n=2 Tax=Flavihumibacter TaxID=1004301 RepID=A0A0E9N382_9BACT|nr:hypothetical protein FPE01S_02_09210 [Flavihumibacter petaseus NBRC 106054]
MFGAKGDGRADDTRPLQLAIDSAVKVSGTLYVPNKYRITNSCLAAAWNGKEYGTFTFKMIGDATWWDVNNRSVIIADFKDGFALGIQRGKGCVVQGINFQGKYVAPKSSYLEMVLGAVPSDTTCLDTRYAVYCAVAVDPVGPKKPSTGGYPRCESLYRGNTSGSTGITIDNCTANGFTVPFITSPNGQTQNAEQLTFSNIRIGDGKFGFVGCQAQERTNLISNVGAWGTLHTLFHFGSYGAGQAGQWMVDRANIAGNVFQIVSRNSSGFYPLTMTRIAAESIVRIGSWYSGVGDVLDLSNIHLKYIDQIGFIPPYHLKGEGLTIRNSNIRYYGLSLPVIVDGKVNWEGKWTRAAVKPDSTYSFDRVGAFTEVQPGQFVDYGDQGSWNSKGFGYHDGKKLYTTPGVTGNYRLNKLK